MIDIDETDLTDDFHRYESLIRRNERGENIGVRASPLFHEYIVSLMATREHWFYLHRLAARAWRKYVHMPRVYRSHGRSIDIFAFSRGLDEEAPARAFAAVAVFARNIEELIATIRAASPKSRIVFIRHPHLQNLLPDKTRRFNSIVPDTVKRVAQTAGVPVFDATPMLEERFGSAPEQLYWPRDMHLNFRGLDAYATLVADFLEPMIRQGGGQSPQGTP